MTTETEDLELLRGMIVMNGDDWRKWPQGDLAVLVAHLPSLLSRTQAAERALEEAGKENARLESAVASIEDLAMAGLASRDGFKQTLRKVFDHAHAATHPAVAVPGATHLQSRAGTPS